GRACAAGRVPGVAAVRRHAAPVATAAPGGGAVGPAWVRDAVSAALRRGQPGQRRCDVRRRARCVLSVALTYDARVPLRCAAALLVVLAACSAANASSADRVPPFAELKDVPPSTVRELDLDRFVGRWYVVV